MNFDGSAFWLKADILERSIKLVDCLFTPNSRNSIQLEKLVST